MMSKGFVKVITEDIIEDSCVLSGHIIMYINKTGALEKERFQVGRMAELCLE